MGHNRAIYRVIHRAVCRAIAKPLQGHYRAVCGTAEPFIEPFIESFIETGPFIKTIQSRRRAIHRAIRRDDAKPFILTIIGRPYGQW
jgi:hypothetical protein